MQKRRILINAISSVLQIVVISVILFIFYRFLLNAIGVEQLGIWSLVIAMTSITQIATIGLSGSVVRYIAKYIAHGENKKISGVIQTAVISICVFVGIALLLVFPAIKWMFDLVLYSDSVYSATKILPYALLAFWLMTITSIFLAGIDGYQLIYIRNYILIGGAIFYLLLCVMIVPSYGLIGLAYANVIQNIIVLILSWYMLKKYIPSLPIIPCQWDKYLFKEIMGYGINFQIISVAAVFYDPITKSLLSKFGGLSMLGYYEMANKMVQQIRALIVSANQVLVPAIADLEEKAPEKIKSMYLTSYRLLFYFSVPLFSITIIGIPIISQIWIGHYERVFVIFGILLSIGWFLNILNAPAYFMNLGTGELRWNVISHIAIGILNVGLGILFGILFNGIGVVIAWVTSLALGSSLICLSYHIRHGISLDELLPQTSKIIMVVCLISVIAVLIINYIYNHIPNVIVINSIMLLFFLILIYIILWHHPMRKRLVGWVTDELLSKEREA